MILIKPQFKKKKVLPHFSHCKWRRFWVDSCKIKSIWSNIRHVYLINDQKCHFSPQTGYWGSWKGKIQYIWVKQSVPNNKWLIPKQTHSGNNELEESWRTAGLSWKRVLWKLYNSSCLLRAKRWVQRWPGQRFWTRERKSRTDLLKEDYTTFLDFHLHSCRSATCQHLYCSDSISPISPPPLQFTVLYPSPGLFLCFDNVVLKSYLVCVGFFVFVFAFFFWRIKNKAIV